jgi:Skp family chaperone for outer membrane proteins
MRRVIVAVAGPLVVGLALPAFSQEAAQKKELPVAHIAVIDMNRISNDSTLGKSYSAKIDALENEIKTAGAKKQAELAKLDSAIKSMQDELEKQANVLSPEGRDKKLLDIKQKQRERQAFLEDGQLEIQRMQDRARQQVQTLNNEFQLKVRPHVEAVAKALGVDVLLDSQSALTINDAYDISQAVVDRLDQEEKPAASTGPATPKAPAPAASPSPSPGNER